MCSMFTEARSFNQPLNNWNVSDRIITNLETKPPKNLENQKKKIIHLI